MDKSRIISLYNEISDDYNNTFSNPSEHIDEFLKKLPVKSNILDAGCGTGIDSVYMASLGHIITGIDLSEKMLDIARKKNSKINFIKKDITALDFKESLFDGIIASYSLIHISKSEVKSCLLNFNRMLKKSGLLNIGLQEGESGEISIPEPFAPKLTLDINIMSLEEVKKLLIDTGFSIIDVFLDSAKNKEEVSFNKLCVIARRD